jgi:hypothetical protein
MRIRLLIYICFIWSGYTVLEYYHVGVNQSGFMVEVVCIDQSEACSDAIEDVNGGEL